MPGTTAAAVEKARSVLKRIFKAGCLIAQLIVLVVVKVCGRDEESLRGELLGFKPFPNSHA